MKRRLLAPATAPAVKTAPAGSGPAKAPAASVDDRLLCDLMLSLGPLGVPFPFLQTWRDRGGS